MNGKQRIILKPVVVACCAVICIAGLFLQFYTNMNATLRKEVQQDLQETTWQSLRLMKCTVRNNLSFLHGMASAVAAYEEIDAEQVLALLAEQPQHHPLHRMAVIRPNGAARTPDAAPFSAAGQPYFERALQGEETVTGPYNSELDGSEIIVFAVPIVRDGIVAGVLRSDYRVEAVEQLLDTGSFDGAGSVHLITASGKMVTPSSFLRDYDTYFDALQQVRLRGGATVDSFRNDLENGRSGMLRFTYQDLDRYVGYLPVGIEDWVLLANVPANVAKEQSLELGRYGVTLLLGVSSVLILLLLYLGILQKKHMRRIRENERELAAMAANIPGGVQCTLCDEGYTVVYASEGVFRLIGCTREEFEQAYQNRFIRVVEPSDRMSLGQRIREQVRENGFYEVEYRICRRDGTVTWVLDKGQAVRRELDGRTVYYSVLVDITASKTAQQELQISEERYRVIMEKTDSVIFEWNMRTGTAQFSDVWCEKLGYPAVQENFPESMTAQTILHPEDRARFLRLCAHISDGGRYTEDTLRIWKRPGGYAWCRVCLTAIRDKGGRPCRAVGVMLNVDREKREMQRMQDRAERDPLTGLYNKGASEQMIRGFLENEGEKGVHALMIIDIDNFKTINDSQGHLFGDTVLTAIAADIHARFRVTDIVGRIGGDEFVVFIKNVQSKSKTREKARQVCQAFRQQCIRADRSIAVSGSIGIAMCEHGNTGYEALFQMADTALYSAKERGKNRYDFYKEGMKMPKLPCSASKIDSDEEGQSITIQ